MMRKYSLSHLRLYCQGSDGVGDLSWILSGACDASQHALDLVDPGADGGGHRGQSRGVGRGSRDESGGERNRWCHFVGKEKDMFR